MVSLRLARELTGRFLECACRLALFVGAFPLAAAAPALRRTSQKRQRTAAFQKLVHGHTPLRERPASFSDSGNGTAFRRLQF